MKTLLIIAVTFFLIASMAFSQVGAGAKYVNAASSLSFSSMKFTYDDVEGDYSMTETVLSFEPSVGYFIMDGLAVGITALYESSKYKEGNYTSDPNVTLGLGVFGKYYYGQNALKPFGKAEIGILSMSHGEEDYQKNSGMAFGLGGGAAYFLNEYVAVEAGLDYSIGSIKNKANSDLKANFGGIVFQVGFTLAF
jgi:hypothetical protein